MIDGIDVTPQSWLGRSDGEGVAHARWSNVIALADEPVRGANLIGFCSDVGVTRAGGRPGAALGPRELRRELSVLSSPEVAIADLGDVIVRGDDLEGAQERLGLAVRRVLQDGGLALVLGGGQEAAYGTYLGWSRLPGGPPGRWGVLNLDAHLDIRFNERATATTPFLQMAMDETDFARDFRYAVVGASRASNTRAILNRASELGIRYVGDTAMGEEAVSFVADFLESIDHLHLSLDLDVLGGYVAPGVSTPSGLGVSPWVVRQVLSMAAESGKLAAFDVTELCPTHDLDGMTSRLAARLIDDTIRRS